MKGLEIINESGGDITLMFMNDTGEVKSERGLPDVLIVPTEKTTYAATPMLVDGSSLILCTSEKYSVPIQLDNVKLKWINVESDIPDMFPLETYSVSFADNNIIIVEVKWKNPELQGSINIHMLVQAIDSTDPGALSEGEKSVTVRDRRPKMK